MAELSGKQYMISAVRRKYTDRIPTTALIGPYCSRLTSHSVRDILTDARKSAEAHLAFYERFQPDSVVIYNDIYLELEALGCELEFPSDNIAHPKSILLDEKSKLAHLKVPDPKSDGRLPYFFEVCERVSSQVRKTAAVGLGHAGPWNLAVHLRGAEQLLTDDMDDPDFIHELMRFTSEVVRTLGDALLEAGFAPSMGEAAASCSLISPKIYNEFILPYHKELCDYFRSKKAPMALHICGDINPMMAAVMQTGISFISLDAPSSLEKMVQISDGRLVIMGNVPTSLFASGTPQEMETAIDLCVETAAEGSGFILSSGCEIPLNATEDRIDHFFKYGHQAGRKYMIGLSERRPELFTS